MSLRESGVIILLCVATAHRRGALRRSPGASPSRPVSKRLPCRAGACSWNSQPAETGECSTVTDIDQPFGASTEVIFGLYSSMAVSSLCFEIGFER